MEVIFGVIFHFIGGFASGSFYIPYKKVRGWHWESYWIVGGLFSWLIVPPLAAFLTIPGFADIISNTGGNIIRLTYFFGLLWGIGGLTYGLGVRYLGVALGSSIILGLCSVFGALIPSIYYDFFPQEGKDTLTDLLTKSWGQVVLVQKLDDEATQNFFISRVSHSKIQEFKKQLKIQAVKAAKEKAIYLADAIGEKAGEALTINEPNEIGIVYPQPPVYANRTMMKEQAMDAGQQAPDINFKKIKFQFEVNATFALK